MTKDERTSKDRRGEHLGERAHLVDLDWVGSECLEDGNGRDSVVYELARWRGYKRWDETGSSSGNMDGPRWLWLVGGMKGRPGLSPAQEATTAGSCGGGMGARGHLRDRSSTARNGLIG